MTPPECLGRAPVQVADRGSAAVEAGVQLEQLKHLISREDLKFELLGDSQEGEKARPSCKVKIGLPAVQRLHSVGIQDTPPHHGL